jgi:flagellar biosynthesis/type III secretory pathway protein FliH
MAKIVKITPSSLSELPGIKIPDVEPPPPTAAEIITVKEDEAELERRRQEDYLRKEYDRIYREAYEAATAQANSDINGMKDHLLHIANQEREEILEKTRNEAAGIIVEAKKSSEEIVEQAKQIYNGICKEAYSAGFTQGFNDKTSELENFATHVTTTVDKLKTEINSKLDEFEQQIEWLAIQIVEKILSAQLSKDNTILINMIGTAIKNIRDAEWITIELSEDLKNLSENLKKITENMTNGVKIDVKVLPNSTENSIILKLEDRIIDISVFTQLQNIKDLFERGF